MSTKDIKSAMMAKRVKESYPVDKLLSTGHTKLNLAISGRSKGGLPKGKYTLIAGQSDGGKTWVGVTALAEAANDADFKGYRLIYVPVEAGLDMDLAYFFGEKLKEQIEIKEGIHTVEQLYDFLEDLQNEKEPFVVVVDSETALQSETENKKQAKQKKARIKGTKEAGSFQGAKQKYHSSHLNVVESRLKETDSILIMISQIRQNMGMGSMFEPWSRPGGLALKFYAHVEIWIHLRGQIKVKYRDKNRQIGTKCLVKVKRTRITGKKQSVDMTIYHDAGIDDVGDNVDYLVDEKHWPKVGKLIRAKEFGKKMTREDLIAYVEKHDGEGRLKKIVRQVWKEIEKAVAVQRKAKYA